MGDDRERPATVDFTLNIHREKEELAPDDGRYARAAGTLIALTVGAEFAFAALLVARERRLDAGEVIVARQIHLHQMGTAQPLLPRREQPLARVPKDA